MFELTELQMNEGEISASISSRTCAECQQRMGPQSVISSKTRWGLLGLEYKALNSKLQTSGCVSSIHIADPVCRHPP